MRRTLSIIAVAAVLAGCTGPDRYRNKRAPDAERITVLVPGFRGTFLYDGDETAYLTLGQALTAGNRSLGSCENGPAPLTFGGPLTWYSVMGYRVDVYRPVLDWGDATQPGFTAFGYDWREDLLVTAKKLCDFIGPRRANLIAHSMGGLIALLAEQQCGDHFDKVVFAAVPFGGAPGLLYDLFSGSKVRLNTALLNPPALWSFPSTWQMLPRHADFLVEQDGRPAVMELDSPLAWQGWTLPCPGFLEARLADRARLPKEWPVPRARVLTVIGKGSPTCSGVRVKKGGLDFTRPIDGDGDGAVPLARAQPPFPSPVVHTSFGHPAVLNDPAVLEAIGRFLAAP